MLYVIKCKFFSIPFHKLHAYVLWRDSKFQIAIENDSIFNADLFDSVAGRFLVDRSIRTIL